MTTTTDEKVAVPRYFAVVDPLHPDRLCYWYRPDRGRNEGQLQPYPPRSRYGVLYRADFPADAAHGTPRGAAFRREFFSNVTSARTAIVAEIAANETAAAARFGVVMNTCCCCGKALTDPHSRVYGIGPECRRGCPPTILEALLERGQAESKVRADSPTSKDIETLWGIGTLA